MSEPDLSVIRQLEAIKERWAGPMTGRYPSGTEKRDYEDVSFLLDLVDKLQTAVADLALQIAQNDRSWAQQVNEVAAMNYASGAHDGALEAWEAASYE